MLSQRLGLEYLHVSNFVIERRLYRSYDSLRSSFEIDDEEVAKELNHYLSQRKDVVLETVYPSLVDNADKVVVLRRHPKVLYDELKRRGWSEIKVIENVEAEILGYVAQEAKEWFKESCEIDTTNLSPEEVITKILENKCDKPIDWLDFPDVQDLLLALDKIIS